jgi:hypothetical protein
VKKHIGVALGLCLSLTLLSASSVSSAAPQIVGTKCAKAGAFRTAKNVKYQCKKSSQGLRWTKIGKATTTTSTTTTSTTMPVQKKQRVDAYVKVLDWAAAARPGVSRAQFSIEFSPGFDQIREKQFREALLWTFLPWERQTLGSGIRVIVIDNKGESFWRARAPSASNCLPPRNEPFEKISHPFYGYGCWNASGERVLLWIVNSAQETWSQAILHHETVHLAQMSIYQFPNGDVESSCLLGEGEASLLGDILGGGLVAAETGHGSAVQTARRIAAKYGLATENDWQSHVVSREPRNSSYCAEDSYNYSIGFLFTEKLLIDFGLEKIFQFKSQIHILSWQEAFRTAFGMDRRDWYKTNFVPYIKSSCTC